MSISKRMLKKRTTHRYFDRTVVEALHTKMHIAFEMTLSAEHLLESRVHDAPEVVNNLTRDHQHWVEEERVMTRRFRRACRRNHNLVAH